MDEVKRKLAAQNVIHMQGKVIFDSSASITSIVNLKSAERLFLLLKHDTPLKLHAHISQAKAASLLKSKLVAQNELTKAVVLWSRLQGELMDRASHCAMPTPAVTVGVKRRRENEGQSLVLTDKTGGEARSCSEEKGDDDSNSSVLHGQERELDSKRKRLDFEHEHQYVDPQSEKLLPPVEQLSFRISCKCSGNLARYFSTQNVSKILGASLTTSLGWWVDLRNPHLEVNVNLTDDYCLLGIPLTKSPLANRSFVKTTGLRSTVAWAMTSLAQIQPGSFVVDPMCGVGSILIEAAQEHSDTYFLGIDIDNEQLVKANENVVYAHLENRMQVLKASSLGLPLHSASVDAIVCDPPFGRKFGTKADAAFNLPLILCEMARVLRVGGSLVLLLSPQLSCLVKKHLTKDNAKLDSSQERGPKTEKQDCPSVAASFTKQLFSQGCANGTGFTQEPEPESHCGQHCANAVSHLRHERSFRVSLGAIDGLIHKYVKSDTCSK